MPSTHTANSISVALFLYLLIAEGEHGLSVLALFLVNSLIALYAGSVMLGRVYCGMHSFLDCAAGAALGCSTVIVYRYAGVWIEMQLVNPLVFGQSLPHFGRLTLSDPRVP